MTAAKIVGIYIGLALAWYFTGSFMAASWNLAEWEPGGRGFAVAIWLVSATVLVTHLRAEGDL